MNAPLGRTPEKMGRCECRDRDHRHAEAARLGIDPATWTTPEPRQCTRDAVRLVTVPGDLNDYEGYARGEQPIGESKQVPMCEPCAQHHECASHTERTTAKGGRE